VRKNNHQHNTQARQTRTTNAIKQNPTQISRQTRYNSGFPKPVFLPVPIKKILVANRSEIAIRVLHRFKADEAYRVGKGPHLEQDMGPIESYLSIEEVLRVAKLSGADAIHPGYGLLSESPEFVDACDEAGILFIGPSAKTMRSLGNKVADRSCLLLTLCRMICQRSKKWRQKSASR